MEAQAALPGVCVTPQAPGEQRLRHDVEVKAVGAAVHLDLNPALKASGKLLNSSKPLSLHMQNETHHSVHFPECENEGRPRRETHGPVLGFNRLAIISIIHSLRGRVHGAAMKGRVPRI